MNELIENPDVKISDDSDKVYKNTLNHNPDSETIYKNGVLFLDNLSDHLMLKPIN